MFHFLQEDFDELDRQIIEIRDKIRNFEKQAGESTEESSETWHDNFAFEQCQRQIKMWSNRIRELINIRDHARIITIENSEKDGRVRFGRTVIIEDVSTGEKKPSYFLYKN